VQRNIVGARQPKNFDLATKLTDAVPLPTIDLIEEIVEFFIQTKGLIWLGFSHQLNPCIGHGNRKTLIWWQNLLLFPTPD
jgi:hypothetical protein